MTNTLLTKSWKSDSNSDKYLEHANKTRSVPLRSCMISDKRRCENQVTCYSDSKDGRGSQPNCPCACLQWQKWNPHSETTPRLIRLSLMQEWRHSAGSRPGIFFRVGSRRNGSACLDSISASCTREMPKLSPSGVALTQMLS